PVMTSRDGTTPGGRTMTGGMPMLRICWRRTGTAVLALIVGCVSSPGKPMPLELAAKMNQHVDLAAGPQSPQRVDSATVNRPIAHISDNDPVDPPNPHYEVLVLSGGGMYGAFTAGVLAGWSETGTRPNFDCVTGVSTGALIATIAFLGPDYDATLARFAELD